MSVPNFVKFGSKGEEIARGGAGKFIPALKSGDVVEFVALTGIEPPAGEEPNGHNCVFSYNEYTLWREQKSGSEQVRSPRFPAIGGSDDPGAQLGLEPRFRGLMLVALKGEEEERIFSFTVSVFKQLVNFEQTLGESIKGQVIRVSRKGDGATNTKYTVAPTGRKVSIEGDAETDISDHLGLKNPNGTRDEVRSEIVSMLTDSGDWPPKGLKSDSEKKTAPKEKKSSPLKGMAFEEEDA